MFREKYICVYALDFRKNIFQKVQRKAFIPFPDDLSGRREKCENKILILQSHYRDIKGVGSRI